MYTYVNSSSVADHSKTARFEKRDFKMPATGIVFGGYFNIPASLSWDFILLTSQNIDMMLVYKINAYVMGFLNEINPFIAKYRKTSAIL